MDHYASDTQTEVIITRHRDVTRVILTRSGRVEEHATLRAVWHVRVRRRQTDPHQPDTVDSRPEATSAVVPNCRAHERTLGGKKDAGSDRQGGRMRFEIRKLGNGGKMKECRGAFMCRDVSIG